MFQELLPFSFSMSIIALPVFEKTGFYVHFMKKMLT